MTHRNARYDVDVRVPMVMAGPGIEPGTTNAAVASHVDLAPTWLAMAGGVPHPEMDGRTILESILHPNGFAGVGTGVGVGVGVDVGVGVGVGAALPSALSGRPEGVAYIEYHGQ